MKKIYVFILLLAFFVLQPSDIQAQKLVIGSKAPSLKDVEWLNSTPADGRVMLIEFFQASNPTSVKFLDKLVGISQNHGDRIAIIVLSRDSRDQLHQLVELPYHIGFDQKGAVYDAYGVMYTPFTMLVDSKGRVAWLGNLGNITESSLTEVK